MPGKGFWEAWFPAIDRHGDGRELTDGRQPSRRYIVSQAARFWKLN